MMSRRCVIVKAAGIRTEFHPAFNLTGSEKSSDGSFFVEPIL
jgi:hypothetical protein